MKPTEDYLNFGASQIQELYNPSLLLNLHPTHHLCSEVESTASRKLQYFYTQ